MIHISYYTIGPFVHTLESSVPCFSVHFIHISKFLKKKHKYITDSKIGNQSFWDCKGVHNRRKTVLTSLQGAWHNHGQKTHCMVRSSTMGSWAKTEHQRRSQGIQLKIRRPRDSKALSLGLK